MTAKLYKLSQQPDDFGSITSEYQYDKDIKGLLSSLKPRQFIYNQAMGQEIQPVWTCDIADIKRGDLLVIDSIQYEVTASPIIRKELNGSKFMVATLNIIKEVLAL